MADNKNEMQLVTFMIGTEHYGINIFDVKEIQKQQTLRSIPNTPGYVEGIFKLRNEVIPVINLHKRFHIAKLERSEDDEDLEGLIILQIQEKKLGIIIDKVLKVLTINTNEIQTPPEIVSGIGSQYIVGVIRQEEHYLIILDVTRLVNLKEISALSK